MSVVKPLFWAVSFSLLVFFLLTALYALKLESLFIYPMMSFFVYSYLCFFYSLHKTRRVDVINIFIIFLMTYSFFGALVFNIESFRDALFAYLKLTQDVFNSDYLFNYNITLLIFNTPLLLLLAKIEHKPYTPSYAPSPVIAQKYRVLGLFTEVIMFLFLLLLAYFYIKTGGKYIWFSDLSGKEQLFGVMAWIVVLLSGLVPFSYKYSDAKNTRKFFFLLILIVVMLIILKIRMFSALFVFLILLNLALRGVTFGRKGFVFLSVGMLGLLFLNILRFEKFAFEDYSFVFLTVMGELIVPNVSAYFLINNPLNFEKSFATLDLFGQLLPSSARPYPELYVFRDFYIESGLDPWPIGGVSYIGQLVFYFEYFAIFPLFLFVLYLRNLRKSILDSRSRLLILTLPMLVMILPRMEIWTLRSCLISVAFFVCFSVGYFILSKICQKPGVSHEVSF